MLAQLDLTKIDRPPESVMAVMRDYDFVFNESIMNRIQAKPHCKSGHPAIWAKMTMTRRPLYRLVTGERNVEIHFEQGYGESLASHCHRVYRITEDGVGLGAIHYFPNNGFIFTNKQPCTSLSLIEFDGEDYILYKADSPGPITKSIAYGVVTTRTGALVAIIIEAGGWFIPKRRIKLGRPAEDILIALMMAAYHGLVFKNN